MEWVQRYHNVHDTTAEHPQMFPHLDLVMRYNASCYDPFHFLMDSTTNDDAYSREWIESISPIITRNYIQLNADDIYFSMRYLYANQNNRIRLVNDPMLYMKRDWFPKSCTDTRERCCLAHPKLNSCVRLRNGNLTVIDPMFESGIECSHCKQLCHEECSAIIDCKNYCKACSDATITFWNDVKQRTGNHDWQFAMYRENRFDKIDNFLIVDNYPKNLITEQTAYNYRRVLKELQFKFASNVTRSDHDTMISGDLITANDESPLVNTLYCDMRLSHLKSTWI